jgi:predicted AlkP superfamily pyrophosphatase or phosphodiesterase
MFSTFVRVHLLVAAVAAVVVGACAAPAVNDGPQGAGATGSKPRLVVFLVVDGLPQRQVTAYRDQLAPDGFARFLDRGAWFADAHYGHSYTVTAAGHATMLSGAYPHRTGIIGNEWRDPATGARVYCTGDTSATYIGHKTDPLDGTSPKNLRAEMLGDVLRRMDARSRVIGISGKDRGAILPAGRAGVAYMYMDSGQFASSTHYMTSHPAWVDAFNARRPADRYFRQAWTPLLPEAAYARSLPDEQPWFGRNGGRLPMMMADADKATPGPAFYRSLLRGPFADVLTLEFARAAIAGEGLGRDDAPDILSVSLSGHDYVNHAFSAESRLSHDHFLQLDRMLQDFFRDLDATVGADRYIAVLTADHGFMPNPEHAASLGLPAGRVDTTGAYQRINAGLQQRFGQAPLLLNFSGSTLLLNRPLMASARLAPDEVAAAARDLLLAEPGFQAAYTRAELLSGSRAGQPFFDAMRRAWHPEVSGEVQFAFKPYWMAGAGVATHGSPHAYDTHVPILAWGPRWIRPGRVDARVEVVDIAPTLARLLGVPAPAQSEGRPLPLP